MQLTSAAAAKVLRFLTQCGLPYREIARAADVSESAIRGFVRRGGYGHASVLEKIEAIIPETWDAG